MNYLPPLVGQQLEVYLSMPKDSVGHVRCIQSFAEPQREVMAQKWREWCREHPDRKGLITDVLIGDLFKPDIDALWPLMEDMQAAEMAAKEPVVAG